MALKKTFCILFILIAFAVNKAGAQYKKFSIEAGPEYRNDNFRWSIAGNEQGTSPNIYSELIFDPIKMLGVHINGKYQPFKKISIKTGFSKLYTIKGSVTDFDYLNDNRTNPKSSLYLQSNKGNAINIAGQINYSVINNHNLNIEAGAGYMFNQSLYYLLDKNDAALQSTYKASWNGPFATLDAMWAMNNFPGIGVGITYNYLKYKAEANWNLIQTFQHPISFTHNANGYGLDYYVKLRWAPHKNIYLELKGLYNNWQTGYGKDNLYLTDGSILKSRMNGAFKKNVGIRLTTAYSF